MAVRCPRTWSLTSYQTALQPGQSHRGDRSHVLLPSSPGSTHHSHLQHWWLMLFSWQQQTWILARRESSSSCLYVDSSVCALIHHQGCEFSGSGSPLLLLDTYPKNLHLLKKNMISSYYFVNGLGSVSCMFGNVMIIILGYNQVKVGRDLWRSSHLQR